MEKYESLLIKSKDVWEESISGGGYTQKKKDKEQDLAEKIQTKQPSSTSVNKPTSS